MRHSRPKRNPVAISAPELRPSPHSFAGVIRASSSRSRTRPSDRCNSGAGQKFRIASHIRNALIWPVRPLLFFAASFTASTRLSPSSVGPRSDARAAAMKSHTESSPDGVNPAPKSQPGWQRPAAATREAAHPRCSSGRRRHDRSQGIPRNHGPPSQEAVPRRKALRPARSLRGRFPTAHLFSDRAPHRPGFPKAWTPRGTVGAPERQIDGNGRDGSRSACTRSIATFLACPCGWIEPSTNLAWLLTTRRQALKSSSCSGATVWGKTLPEDPLSARNCPVPSTSMFTVDGKTLCTRRLVPSMRSAAEESRPIELGRCAALCPGRPQEGTRAHRCHACRRRERCLGRNHQPRGFRQSRSSRRAASF